MTCIRPRGCRSSVSKTVTAAAVVNAVAMNVVKQDPATIDAFDQPVQQFLPKNFASLNPFSPLVTLRNLLQHRGYLSNIGSFYADLKRSWEIGPQQKPGQGFQYSNTGYALLRIVLPYLVHGRHMFEDMSEQRIDHVTSVLYRSWVRSHVLKPCGISNADADVNPVGKHPSFHFGMSPSGRPSPGFPRRRTRTLCSRRAPAIGICPLRLSVGSALGSAMGESFQRRKMARRTIGGLSCGTTTWGSGKGIRSPTKAIAFLFTQSEAAKLLGLIRRRGRGSKPWS